ncbi:hypothetical protein Lal_00047459 [Lupinus albus]|nr:hypothetical protein Lal_00047459 [Lupinus albus]
MQRIEEILAFPRLKHRRVSGKGVQACLRIREAISIDSCSLSLMLMKRQRVENADCFSSDCFASR